MLQRGAYGEADAKATGGVAVPVALVRATKAFGGTIALKDASFELRSGEVLALLGENGAGKSTCVKLLAGVHSPTEGHVDVDGKPVVFSSPHDAQAAGISVMHQHPGLFPDLSIAENIYLGHMPRDRLGGIDNAAIIAGARRVLATVGLDAPAETRLGTLRTSEQQLVEIARALSLDARVLIMDEPTAALSQREVERLFAVVADLRLHGVAMMFVGHRMDEIFRDRRPHCGVARRTPHRRQAEGGAWSRGRHRHDGRPRSDRPLSRAPSCPRRACAGGEGAFARRRIFEYRPEASRWRDSRARRPGRQRANRDRARAVRHRPAGRRRNPHRRRDLFAFASARDAMAARIAYVSEDRMGQSLVMDFSILDNAVLPVLDKAAPAGLYSTRRAIDLVSDWLKRMKLRFSGYGQPVKELSGGNQQKVVLAKWLRTEPRVLILDEPTQGIDVGTKAEVHAMVADLAAQGMAIILISSEMPELIGMCDRIVVLREGQRTAEFARGEATQEKVLERRPKTSERADRQARAAPLVEEKKKGPLDVLEAAGVRPVSPRCWRSPSRSPSSTRAWSARRTSPRWRWTPLCW